MIYNCVLLILLIAISLYYSDGGIEALNPHYNRLRNEQPFRVLFKQLNKREQQTLFIPDAENEITQIDTKEFFRDYQSTKSIHNFLARLAKLNPHLARMISIGKSAENRDLFVIQIGKRGTNHHKNNKPIIWIDACIHAREWIACATACFVITQLIDEYNAKNLVTMRLLDTFDFYILPIVNPDGYEYTYLSQTNRFKLANRFWRKNRSIKSADPKCVGVDLNRNFDFHWNTTGVESNPCLDKYPGLSPESEPETAAIVDFIWRHKQFIKCYVSLHAYGQYVLYPWFWSKKKAPDGPDLHNKATIAIKALASLFNSKYTVDGSEHLLDKASGTSADWAYGKAGIKYSYVIELRGSGDRGLFGFLLPPEFIDPTGRETYAAILALASEIMKEISY